MDKGVVFAVFSIGVLEIVLSFMTEKMVRKNYENKEIKNIEGLVNWEKYSNLIIGAMIIGFGVLFLTIPNSPIINLYVPLLAVVYGISYFGRKRFI